MSKITSTAELIQFHNGVTDKCREIMKKKNSDYANPAVSGDPFANFKGCEVAGLCSAETGVLIRMQDKMSRLATLLKKDASVVEESFEDTCLDLCNYAIILAAMRKK